MRQRNSRNYYEHSLAKPQLNQGLLWAKLSDKLSDSNSNSKQYFNNLRQQLCYLLTEGISTMEEGDCNFSQLFPLLVDA